MRLKAYPRPIIPFLLSFMSGILAGSEFPDHFLWAFGVLLSSTILVVWKIGVKKTARLSPIVLFFCLGYLSLQPWIVPRFPANHVVNFSDTHPWKITGTVDSNPLESNHRLKFVLKAENLTQNFSSFPVVGKIQITIFGHTDKLFLGDKISFAGRIKSLRNFNNPGGFNYKRYMAFKGIWVSAYASANRLSLLTKNSEQGIRHITENARQHIARLIETVAKGEEQKCVLKALIVGYRHDISRDLREAFNRTGIGHVLAISGLHIGIVATGAFLLFSWILSYFKPLLWRAWTRKGAGILSVFPVLSYGLLAGLSPSTQRAVIMVTVFLLTFLIEREHDPMNTLAVAAMLILIISPPSLFSISFQLSFVAVYFIIYGLNRIYKIQPADKNVAQTGWRHRILKKLLVLFWVTIFATVGTLPLVMFYFNRVSLVGLFANLAIVPIVGFLVVPLGLIGVFIYPLSIDLAAWFIKASALLLTPVLELVNFLASLSWASVNTVTPTFLEICCVYILIWALLNLKRDPTASVEKPKSAVAQEDPLNAKQPFGLPHRTRTIFETLRSFVSGLRHVKIITVAILLVMFVDVFYWINYRFWHDDLRVTIIDVGQGSAALLEIPGGDCVLIDGGGFPDNTVFDVGARIVAPFLWRKKIRTVDSIVLSHPSSDHMNGLVYIAENFDVKCVWSNGETTETRSYKDFIAVIKKKRIYMPAFKDSPRVRNINGVALNILYPPTDFLAKSVKEKWRNLNNNSIVLKVQFGSTSFLFPGDIMAGAEGDLVAASGDTLKSTFLISPHHGSKTSSTPAFLNKVKPEYVIISSGWKTGRPFPHPSVLKRYTDRRCKVFRTDTHGAMAISTDGRTVTIRPTIEGLSHNPMS